MPERPVGPADWLRKTVTDFDRANAPKVEEVKKEVVEEVVRLDPAAPPVAKVEEPVKVEEKAVPVPPVAEVAPAVDATPASTVPPAVAPAAPVVTPAATTTPVAGQPPTSPLK